MSLYPHTATIWSKGDEVAGCATWTPLGHVKCRFEGASAIHKALQGEQAMRDRSVLIDHTEGLQIKPGDAIMQGVLEDNTPPSTALSVLSAEPLCVGSGTVHHWEVTVR